ncbi:MAG: hypothetical protein ILA24_08695 [Ruminococcus sp.]|nr:hypothetical protein [Ruminococcus sp.]
MKQRIIAAFVMLAACVCFTACGEDTSSRSVADLLSQLNDSGGKSGNVTSSVSEDEQVMLVVKCEPSIQSDKAKNTVIPSEYKVYFSGRVTDERTGRQTNISGADLDKLKKYAQDIVDHKIQSKFDGGDPDTDTTVAAYDKTYKSNQLTAQSKCSIDSFDEMYKIVADKFKG